eukprot:gene132-132_t
MKIHEYQGKEILRNFGVPVPRGIPAFTVQEAVEAAQKLGGPVWVVKAQIHAGGRGKGGGVKVAKTIDDVKARASEILGMQLVTHQTGAEGQKVRRLYIEDGADIKNELYVSLVTDRATQKVALIASSEGGMDIEEVAHSTPEKIITEMIDPLTGITEAQSRKVAAAIGLTGASIDQAVDIFAKIYKCYMDTDASLVEINPLNCDSKGNLMALDAKFNFDANALFRHPEIVAFRDLDEEDPAEVEASKFDLAYISLDGNIGCLVNGAGLAMATMDTIKLFGGEPANFLDVGGGATPEKVTEAFKIMLKNPKVEGILVNIFGGIMKCDTIATGVITACKAVNLNVPLVVRMKGTNEELGKKMLAESGLPIIAADTMAEAATKIVAAGITGKTGQFHTEKCQEYANGKNCFVAGVNPKKAGESIFNIPIYASVKEAAQQTGATVSVIYVPPAGAADAIWEAVEADLDMAICITEGIPVKDMLMVRNKMKAKEAAGGKKTLLLGPNCPGLITPDEIKIGIMPGHIHRKGRIGVVSRSGTLTYEAVAMLTEVGLGQSSAVGIGGDPINGLKHIDVMKAFNDDPDTDAVIMIGEIGGPDEAEAAQWCKANMKKPIVGFIAGVTAPPGKRMGHAGALISGGADTADAKLAIMEESGFIITRNPSELGKLLKAQLKPLDWRLLQKEKRSEPRFRALLAFITVESVMEFLQSADFWIVAHPALHYVAAALGAALVVGVGKFWRKGSNSASAT